MTQSKPPKTAPAVRLSLPLLLALSVTACAHNSPPPVCSCPQLPAPPSVSTPQPSVDYSISAQQLLQTWQAKLKATPLTPE